MRRSAAGKTLSRNNATIYTLLVAATLGVYAPVISHPFINYDDDVYVVNNPHVDTGLNWQNFKWAWTAMSAGNWHPITWLSHQLDCQLFGLHASGHHAVSLLLHSMNVLLLFWLLNRVTGARWQSMVVAALFALHPLNVESVAWVAERKNLLCSLFFLLALGAYGWFVRKPQIKSYLGVVVLFALALASKPMAVTLPFVLLLVDFWPLGRIKGWSTPSLAFPVTQQPIPQLVREKLPLFALSAGSAWVTILAQRSSGAMGSFAGWTAKWRVENAIHAYAAYLWKTLVPHGLAPFYPGSVLRPWEVFLALAFLATIGFLVYKLGSRRPYVLIGLLWFLGMLLPVIGLIQVGSQAMADRYTYLPCIGIFVALVWGISNAIASVRYRPWLVAAAAIALASSLTLRQLQYWRSSYDLWSHTLDVTTNNFVAEENLGASLVALGRSDDALPHFSDAVRIDPSDAIAQINLGTALIRQDRAADATEHFEAAAHFTKDPLLLADAYKGLGVTSAQMGDRKKARQYFVQALKFTPNDSTNLYNLSLVNVEDAIDKMSLAVSAHPSAEGYLQLGQLLQENNQTVSAQSAFEKSLQMNPNLTDAKQALLRLKGGGAPSGSGH